MIVIGITGPSGAGKGELSKILFKKYGLHIIDADKVYHSFVSCSSDCLDEIRAEFGEDVITPEGSLDRKKLRDLVWGDENREKLLLLNKITHKHVVKDIREHILFYKKQNKSCIIDAPLLIEAGLRSDCTFTISVLADKKIRAERISQRDNIELSDAMKRISSQKPDVFYIENTDYVIENNGDISTLEASLKDILSERRVID